MLKRNQFFYQRMYLLYKKTPFWLITKNMKIYTFLLFTLFSGHLFSQNNFEYERTWGTYFGANGGTPEGIFANKGILFDSQRNMHMRGHVSNTFSYGAAYFNQFLIGGGNPYNSQQQGYNLFEAKISSMGVLSYYGYHNSLNNFLLENIDSQDNKYYILHSTAPAILPTAGVYLTNDPQPSSTMKTILVKYSPSGTLLWASYLPTSNRAINIEFDEADNLYISGRTTINNNVSTAGVLQENFDLVLSSSGDPTPNDYLLKLSPSGQRIWGTYTPFGIGPAMKYYNGSLYIISGKNINPALNTTATPGAYQTSVTASSITKMNATNGTREWGTYYGPSESVNYFSLADIAVNETGIYITGTDYNYDNASFFGTPTSYKQYVTGGSDIFLSKFSLSGDREWSTYFGSSAEDMNEFDKVIAVNGNDIYITGNTIGSGSNIATTGSYQAAPQQNNSNSVNLYFAKFNSSGNLVWSSYYGGTSDFPTFVVPINVAFKDNSLYLFGSTNSNTGYSTEGSWMPVRNPANTIGLTSFIARFDNKSLGTSENAALSDLVLFDNPNNGNFSLRGKDLTKAECSMKIYDMAGRMITAQKLSNAYSQHFNMQNILKKGNYIIEISASRQSLKTFKMTVR